MLTVAFLVLPIVGLTVRVPWARVPELLATPRAVDALGLSLGTCLVATALVVVIGFPSALVLARAQGRWAQWCRTLLTLPMVLPPVVAGLALLLTLGRRGMIGRPLALTGFEIGFTTVAVIIAQVFVALPYLLLTLEGALRAAGSQVELAAAHLGASPTRVLFTVTVPRILPAAASGTAMAFARALGEFGATLTFAGSLQGITRTLPLEIYLLRESDTDLALALAMVMLAAAAVVLGCANWMRGRHA